MKSICKALVAVALIAAIFSISMATATYSLSLDTDKYIYHPGEEVIIYGYLTEDESGVPDATIGIEVKNPGDATIWIGTAETDGSGYYEDSFALADDAINGTYMVYVASMGVGANTTFEVTGIIDNTPPVITDVDAFPDPQVPNGYVNITCTVTDNVALDTIMVNITGPDEFTPVNVSMDRILGTDSYYYNSTYDIVGTYDYFIWANDTSGNENVSAPFTFTIDRPSNTPSEPSPENDATGVNIYTGLHWTGGDPDPGDTVTYDVYFGTESLHYKGTTSNTSYSFPTPLSYDITYYWKIVAKDNHNATTEGSIWNFRTQSAPSPPPGATEPKYPRNLTARAGDTDGEYWIKLDWEVPMNDGGAIITNYKIYRSTVAGSEVYLNIVGNVTTYTDTDLEVNVTYYYQVSAVNSVGEGTKSNEANATTVDKTLPTITDQKISPTKVKVGEKVNISANATDPSGIDMVYVVIEKEGGEVKEISLTKIDDDKWSATWKPSNEGTYKLFIKAIDMWGKERTVGIGEVKVEKKGIPGFGALSLIGAIAIVLLWKRGER